MGKKIILAMICIMVLSSAHTYSYAFAGHGQGKASPDFFKKFHNILNVREQLNLNEDQIKKIENEMVKARKEVIMAKAEIEIISLDIKMELKQGKINEKSVNKLIDQQYELKKNKMKSLVDAYAKIKKILTKEQRKMLSEICDGQRREWRGAMFNKYKGGQGSFMNQGKDGYPVK